MRRRILPSASRILLDSSRSLSQATSPEEIAEMYLADALSKMQPAAGALLRRLSGTEHEFVAMWQEGRIVPRHLWPGEAVSAQGRMVTRLDAHGVIERIVRGEVVTVVVDDALAAWAPGAAEFHRRMGHTQFVSFPVWHGPEVIGYLSLAYSDPQSPSPEELRLIEVLRVQAALALQLQSMSEKMQQTAIARTRENEAQQRAVEAAKANQALQSTIDALSAANSLDEMVPLVLRIVGTTFGALSCAIYENDSLGKIFLRYWLVGGKTLTPEELLQLDPEKFALVRVLAAGFEVPDDYLGRASRHLIGPVVLDHAKGTSVPAFDRFAVDLGWNWELNIGIAAGAIRASTLVIYRTEPFTPHEIRLAETLAKQIGLAVETRRLAEEARRSAIERELERAEQQRAESLASANAALSRSVARLTSADDLGKLLDSVLLEAVNSSGAVSGAFFLLDLTGQSVFNHSHLIRGEWIDVQNDSRVAIFRDPRTVEGNLSWQVLTQHSILWLDNEKPCPYEWEGASRFHQEMGHRFVAVIPMSHGDTVVGFLGLAFDKSETTQPLDSRLDLCRVLAQQAALAVRLTRLGEEARKAAVAVEKEAAAAKRAEELARANNVLIGTVEAVAQSGDIAHLIEHFLMQAIRLAGASGGAFTRYEEGRFKDHACFVLRGAVIPPSEWQDEPFVLETADFLNRNRAGFFERLMTEKITRDRVEDAWQWWPAAAEFHSRWGHVEVWNIACISRGAVIASLGLGFAKTPAPDSVDDAMLLALAQQATLALELNRLSDEEKAQAISIEREKAEHQRLSELMRTADALKQTLDVVAFEPDLNKVLGQVLSSIARQLDSPSSALWLLDRVSGAFTLHSVLRDGAVVSGEADLEASRSLWGGGRDLLFKNHIYERSPVVYQVEAMRATNFKAYAFLHKHGVRTALGIPLLLGQEIVGSLTIRFMHPRTLSAEELQLTQALAHQATMAIQLTALAHRAGEAALIEERVRFSRHLHDTLAQGFTGILMQLGAASQVSPQSVEAIEPQLQAIEDLARASLAEARRSVRSLRLSAAAEPLPQAFEQVVQRIRLQSKLTLTLQVNGQPFSPGPQVETELIRILQEALHNVIKHAQAKDVEVSLEFQGKNAIRVAIKDDGKGFDPTNISTDSFGLLGMQERAASCGASFTVISEPGRGTQIVVQYGRGATE